MFLGAKPNLNRFPLRIGVINTQIQTAILLPPRMTIRHASFRLVGTFWWAGLLPDGANMINNHHGTLHQHFLRTECRSFLQAYRALQETNPSSMTGCRYPFQQKGGSWLQSTLPNRMAASPKRSQASAPRRWGARTSEPASSATKGWSAIWGRQEKSGGLQGLCRSWDFSLGCRTCGRPFNIVCRLFVLLGV